MPGHVRGEPSGEEILVPKLPATLPGTITCRASGMIIRLGNQLRATAPSTRSCLETVVIGSAGSAKSFPTIPRNRPITR